MNEHTLIRTVQLPAGQRWTWYRDANVVGISADLCPAGRREAIVAALTVCQRELADAEAPAVSA